MFPITEHQQQRLQTVAQTIANSFPPSTKARYQDAAIKLRVPFWDWAKALPTDQPIVPTAISNEKVQVTFSNGTSASINNPLLDYNFHPLDNTQIVRTVS
jgi:tyrosinase